MRKFTGEMLDPNPATHVFGEPAQSKRTGTFHKSLFVWKFTGNWPDTDENTSIKHQAVALTVRTALSVATLFGELIKVFAAYEVRTVLVAQNRATMFLVFYSM